MTYQEIQEKIETLKSHLDRYAGLYPVDRKPELNLAIGDVLDEMIDTVADDLEDLDENWWQV